MEQSRLCSLERGRGVWCEETSDVFPQFRRAERGRERGMSDFFVGRRCSLEGVVSSGEERSSSPLALNKCPGA